MARTDLKKIEFDAPMTVAEGIEALEDLRARVGGDAQVRVVCFVEFQVAYGARVKAISAHLPRDPA